MLKKLFLLVILIQFVFSQKLDMKQEELIYLVGFRYFSAGNAYISINNDSLNGDSVYLLETFIKTNKFLDKFYKIRDKTSILIDPTNYSILKIDKDINEGNYKQKYSAFNQGDTLLVWNNSNYKINSPVYDPISFVYYLREKNLLLGDQFTFSSAGPKGIKIVEVNVTQKEHVSVPAGTFECLKIEPRSPINNALLKNNGEMKVWLSNDKKKIPVKIEMKTNVGNIIMKLDKSRTI
tara:strand:+ start:477 stop:1184 length:708 start_codon:yes stop_codon:yes gene_type:complete